MFVPELNMENQIDKQMGCMTGFLQIFDRHQILAGKRLYSTKRLLPPPVFDTMPVISAESSPVHIGDSGKQKQQIPPSPERLKQWFPSAELPLKSPLPLPMSESKDGSKLYRSHNLIAKLMGLEPLPNTLNTQETEKKPELRRSSSSESGFLHSRLIMESEKNSPLKQKNHSHSPIVSYEVINKADSGENVWRNDDNGVNLSPWKEPQHRKSFFDSKHNVFSEQGEIENRLKMGGIEESTKDLETLNNILEALQHKGLLHSPAERNHTRRHRKFLYDESPIVVMKPCRSSITSPLHRRTDNEYTPANGRNPEKQFRRSYSVPVENPPPVIPQRARRANSLVKPKSPTIETQRRVNELTTDNRRVVPVLPPQPHTGPPRSKKATGKDESHSIHGSRSSTSPDTESSKTEGWNLLERCDKLLHSIAEMTTTAADMEPSPVSVLDSFLYRDDSFTAPPIMAKRIINFKDQYGHHMEEETWSSEVSPISQETSEDSDFLYISDIISASNLHPGESGLFLLLEKQQFQKGKDSSKASRLQRKVFFDTIIELLKWIRRLPPWKNVSWTTDNDVTSPSLDKVWFEFQRIRYRGDAGDVYDIVCGVLKKDFVGDEITGWKGFPMEMSETILDMERSIFKDLVSETIRDLAALASENRLLRMSRKKVLWK